MFRLFLRFTKTEHLDVRCNWCKM